MERVSWSEIKRKRLEGMTSAELDEYERAYLEVSLAAEVGDNVRAARESAGLSQRELARRIGTSQSAINRLEAGGVGATLTTLQRVASALSLHISVELHPSA